MPTEVEEMLANGQWIRDLRKKGKRSEVWSHFYRVKEASTKELLDFAFCNKCNLKLKFPPGCSTSNLKKHKCYLVATEGDNPSEPKKVKLTEAVKQDVADGFVSFVAEDMRSFRSVQGSGFKKMISACVRAGVSLQTDNFDVDDIIPHPTTISRKVKEKHAEDLSKLVENIKPKIDAGDCACSFDLWTDKHTNKNFLTFNVTYLDDQWKFQSVNLFTIQMYSMDEYGNPTPKSGFNIAKAIEAKLTAIGLPGRLKKFTCVSDQGSNLVKMCADQKMRRLDCAAHILNTILTNTFNDAAMKKDAPGIHKLLNACKSLVEFCKRSSTQELLTTRLKQHCKTRWNTHAEMLYSITKNYDDIFTILSVRNKIELLNDIDPDILSRLLELLKPFKKATQFLEGDSYVTIHEVMLKVKALQDHLQSFIATENNDELKWVATRCQSFLEAKFKFSDEQKIAAFLFPAYRQMNYLSEEEREDVHKAVRKSLGLEESTSTASSPSRNSGTEDNVEEPHDNHPTPSSSSSSENEMSDFERRHRDVPLAPDADPTSHIKAELELYKKQYTENIKNVVEWWRDNSHRFPVLSNLARRILGIPATSAASERMFSRSGRILEDRRSSLSTQSLEACMFISSNSS